MPSTGDIVRASDFEAIKPQLSIGTVTTGNAGTNASATITGTSPNFVLNLTIPRGNTGATGATGATGPAGPSGVYTGPLKPTSSYWKGISVRGSNPYGNTPFQLPSGGTWAYYVYEGFTSGGYSSISVAAGGTQIGFVKEYGTTSALVWRIQ